MASYIGTNPPVQRGIVNRFQFTATASQTVFSGADNNGDTLFYISENPTLVFLNGVQLVVNTDYTQTDNNTITLSSGAALNDEVEIMGFGSFDLNNAATTRSQLGLGTAAVEDVGTSAGNVLQLNGSAQIPAVDGSLLTNLPITFPTVSSISPSAVENTQTQITITGTNFVNGAKVEVQNSSTGAIFTADTVSFTNSTTLVTNFTLTTDGTYFVRVENPDGYAGRSSTAILSVSDAPTWTTAAGSLGSVAKGDAFSATVVATSDSSVTYSKTTGSFPTGITLASGTGVISGTEAGSDTSETTYNFTIRATDGEGQTADRAFSITVTVGINNGGQFN
jgi:hypothetical protein